MCGIFGSYSFNGEKVSDSIVKNISSSLHHRGPDNSGHFQNSTALLGNCRLSILDLSEKSNQPIVSEDKQTVVVQNGEIYNYIELREELRGDGFNFQTDGDTEVILKAFERWGPSFIKKLNGMFAIAIYSKREEKLFLYRDRLGVKPLFYTQPRYGQRFWFASEIKAILENGKVYKPNLEAIAQFFALNYVPSPYSVFEDIWHVEPGHMMTISKTGGVKKEKYWDLLDVIPEDQMTVADAKSGLIKLLDDATRIRMRSDANYGAFLSGGLDSSSVVGLMSMYSSDPIKTFSIGFEDLRFDESKYAYQASNRFGTNHKRVILNESSRENWPFFIWYCDQPHGDVSFIPTGEIAKIASSEVKMVLTGDGGDELFAGYEKYLNFFDNKKFKNNKNNWMHDYAETTGLLTKSDAAYLLQGQLLEVFNDKNPYRSLENSMQEADQFDDVNKVLYADTVNLLPGNNLVKPDRMAMAHSLEVRSPFLDYRLAEFAFSIPGEFKLNDGETKWIYKKAVEPLLGENLTYRKKQMFTVPIGEWFKTTLKTFCDQILLDGRLESRKICNIELVKKMMASHIAGKNNYTRQLRALISLEIWFRLFIDKDEEWIIKAQK